MKLDRMRLTAKDKDKDTHVTAGKTRGEPGCGSYIFNVNSSFEGFEKSYKTKITTIISGVIK